MSTKPFFVLAPMDDVSDTVFRQIINSTAAPDLFFTEFANVDGLQSPGRPKLLKKLRMTDGEGPLVAQLWGLKPENFEKTAREVSDGTFAREFAKLDEQARNTYGDAAHGDSEARNEPYLRYGEVSTGVGNKAMRPKAASMAGSARQQGKPMRNFVGIDLNMGCPAKSEVKNGTCSALINNRPLASEIIKATQKGAGNLPVSVKTRLGFSAVDLTWIEFLLEHNVDMITVHLRTRKEMSKVPAHWEYMDEIIKLRDKISLGTKIVGNGDVLTRLRGEELAEKYNLDGIMIGRGVFHDPFVFSKVGPRKWENYDIASKIELFRRHVQLFQDTWHEGERPIHTLNKFCKIYINGFDGAKEMRDILMSANSTEDLLAILAREAKQT